MFYKEIKRRSFLKYTTLETRFCIFKLVQKYDHVPRFYFSNANKHLTWADSFMKMDNKNSNLNKFLWKSNLEQILDSVDYKKNTVLLTDWTKTTWSITKHQLDVQYLPSLNTSFTETTNSNKSNKTIASKTTLKDFTLKF